MSRRKARIRRRVAKAERRKRKRGKREAAKERAYLERRERQIKEYWHRRMRSL